MSYLAETLAALVLWLSATALCQFGVAVERQAAKVPPKVERTVARTPRQQAVESTAECPHRQTAAVSA